MANFFQQKKAQLRACSATPHRWLGAFFIAALLDVLDAGEYLLHAGVSLARNWESKSAVAGAVAIACDTAYAHLTGVYGTLAIAYFWIITLDVVTKWLAIGNKYLLARGLEQEHISTFDKWSGVLLAFQAKKLTSRIMLGGYLSKFVLFGIGLAAAKHIDSIFAATQVPLPMTVMTFTLGYFCYHEAISIAENLRDAGNKHMDKLVELLNANIFNKLKR